MAHNLYLELTLEGVRVVGVSLAAPPGREDDIECQSFQYSLGLSVSAGSGQSVGRRKHKPIVIQKHIDATSPLLTQALVTNKGVTGIFRFYKPDDSGSLEHYFTVEIREARIASVSQNVFPTFRPDTSLLPEIEEVSFIFDRIMWTHVTGGTESEDRVRGGT
jgi:type VI secretion system secreted protein Hcp